MHLSNIESLMKLLLEYNIDTFNGQYATKFRWKGYQVLTSHSVGDKVNTNITAVSNKYLLDNAGLSIDSTLEVILTKYESTVDSFVNSAKNFTNSNDHDVFNLTLYRVFDDITILQPNDENRKVSAILVYDVKATTTFPFVANTKLAANNYKSLINPSNAANTQYNSKKRSAHKQNNVKTKDKNLRFVVPKKDKDYFIEPLIIINAFTGDFYIDEFNKKENAGDSLLKSTPYRGKKSGEPCSSGSPSAINLGSYTSNWDNKEILKELLEFGINSETGNDRGKSHLPTLKKYKKIVDNL